MLLLENFDQDTFVNKWKLTKLVLVKTTLLLFFLTRATHDERREDNEE